MTVRRRLAAIALALLGIGLPGDRAAAAWPDRPIRIVVPWPAGGSADLVGRVFGDLLAKRLDATVVVDNRAGANGLVGTNSVATAPADGYTLLSTTSEPLTVNPSLYNDLPYDVEKHFEPLGLLARTYFVIAASKAFPADDVQGAIALARQSPGKYAVGSYGIADMFLAYFESVTGTSFLRVPYQGAAPAMAATVSNDVALTLVASSTGIAAGGAVKLLGVGSPAPLDSLPGVKPFVEQGLPGFLIGNWIAVSAPQGIPAAAREALAPAIADVVRSPDFKARLVRVGIDADYAPGDQVREMLRTDTARWRKLVAEKGLKPN